MLYLQANPAQLTVLLALLFGQLSFGRLLVRRLTANKQTVQPLIPSIADTGDVTSKREATLAQ